MEPLVVLRSLDVRPIQHQQRKITPKPSKKRSRNRRALFSKGKYYYTKEVLDRTCFLGWAPLKAVKLEKDDKDGGDFCGFTDSDIDESQIHKALSASVTDGEDLVINKTKVVSFSPDNSIFYTFYVNPVPRIKLRCLSLFDGLSTALHILSECLHLDLEVYYSCEICPDALAFQREKYAGRIVQLGNVCDWTNEDALCSLQRVDILVGASPCNDLASVNPKRRGLHDPESTGQLFFSYRKIRDILSKRMASCGYPFFWLYENTFNMPLMYRTKIAEELGSKPVVLCSSSYMPAYRKRMFFGNVPGLADLEKDNARKEPNLRLQDIIGPNRQTNKQFARTITSNTANQVSVTDAHGRSALYINDLEYLLGFPRSHTDVAGLGVRQRTKLLAKGWSVDVVQDILKPLTEMYVCKV